MQLDQARKRTGGPAITCGPGTVLDGTMCVLADGGAGGSGGSAGNGGSAGVGDASVITCGPGTVLEGSVCVVAKGGAGGPEIKSFTADKLWGDAPLQTTLSWEIANSPADATCELDANGDGTFETARAMRGNWHYFPVSPKLYESQLIEAAGGDEFFDWRGTNAVIKQLDRKLQGLTRITTSAAQRLSLYRAALTVTIKFMERGDDSLSVVAMFCQPLELDYLELLKGFLATDGLLRDLLELATWEEYGLFTHTEPFLASLPEKHANRALRELASIIAELRREGLKEELKTACNLRQAVLSSVDKGTVLVERDGAAKASAPGE